MTDEQSSHVAENWEEINEEEIFEQSQAVSEKNHVPLLKGPIVIQGDDSFRSQYLPPEPSVKILKRPAKDERLNENGGDVCLNGSQKPIKSYEQREAEYAEARQRIMGQRDAPDIDDRVVQYEASPAKYTLLRPSVESSRINPEVLRSPRGPDDTNGFTIRR